MNVSVFDSIPDELYQAQKNFDNLTIYHTKPWHKFLEHTFGWRSRALVGIGPRDQPIMVLPFVRKYRLGKRINIALPLSHHIKPAWHPSKKPLPSHEYPPLAFTGILGDIEVHGDTLIANRTQAHLCDITELNLKKFESEEKLFRGFDYKSVRYMINRALKSNLEIISGLEGKQIDDLYQLVVETRMRQGSPLYPASFFKNLCNAFPYEKSISVRIAYLNGKPISGNLFLFHRKEAIYTYSASTNNREIVRLGANELLMWLAIQEAFRRGMQRVDFGISSVTLPGLKAYKEKWGGISTPLNYTYFNSKGRSTIINRQSPLAKKTGRLLQAMPKWLFTRISPIILRTVA